MDNYFKKLRQLSFLSKSQKIVTLSITCCVILGGASPTINSTLIKDIDETFEDDYNEEIDEKYKTTGPPDDDVHAFASFSWKPRYPDPGEEVTFTSTSSAIDGHITSERWNFEGGHTVYGHTTTYTFEKKGSYKVALDVHAVGYGGSDWDTETSYVKVGADPFPRITCTPKDPAPGQEVRLDASKSNDPDGEITSYKWSYYNSEDPGNVIDLGSDKVVYHTWDDQGVYNIVLFIEDDKGNNNTLEKTIRVSIIKLDGFPTRSRGINFEIINQGNITANNVRWNVEINRYIKTNIGPNSLYNESGGVYTLNPGNSETISLKNFRRRFRKIELVVTAKADNAVEVSKSFHGLIFGKHIYLSEENFVNPYSIIVISGLILAFILFVIFTSINQG